MMLFLAKDPIVDRYDMTSVGSVMCGAAPLSAELENIFSERHKTIPIKQGKDPNNLIPKDEILKTARKLQKWL